MTKEFKITSSEIKKVIDFGFCMATDDITVKGKKVGCMYRNEPSDKYDSGWVFMRGQETQEYLDDSANIEMYEVNTIANYDAQIIDFLNAPVGSAFARNLTNDFVEVT